MFEFVTKSNFGGCMSEGKNQHGGARPGAGRKTKYEKTVVTRVPEKYLEVVKALIAHLDETAGLNKHYLAAESEAVFLRSLDDNKQHIIFKTNPL
jgi:hypothetical protein